MFRSIYDNGAVNVRKQDADAQLAVKRVSPNFPFAISGGDVTLYHDLVVLFATQWDVDAESFGTAGTPSGSEYQQQMLAIDVVKSLPFGRRLQVIPTSSDGFQLPFSITRADKFQHYTQPRARAYTEDELLRHAQLHDLAFNSHPFLSLIVCRTMFLGDVEEKSHDKLLYDAVLIAGLGIKRFLAQNLGYAQRQPHGLPDLDKLVRTTTCTLYGSKLGSLEAASLHRYAQCMMILAWHELTQGLFRRAATWWTSVCGLILRIRDLREQEESAAEFQINGIDMHLVIGEELDNMQTIAQLVLLWLELHLAPIPADTSIVSGTRIWQSHENSFSWISELDHASGKLSATEAHRKSWIVVCSISRVLGSLVESFTDFKLTNRLIDMRMLLGTANDDAAFRVSTALPHARATHTDASAASSAGDFIAAALISLTELLVSFQAGHATTSLSAQGVANIVRACAAITLQLRSAFGDPHPNFDLSRVSDSNAAGRSSVSASCFVDVDGSCIVLTMVETIALSFELLLTQANIRIASEPEASRGAIILPQEAQRTVSGELGSILGIISTITEFFDNIPRQGNRQSQVSRLLGRMQDQLEMLGVQPDVSFAFDVAFGQSKQDTWRGDKAELKGEPGLQMRPYEMAASHPSTAVATGISRFRDMVQCPSYLTVDQQPPISLDIAASASRYDLPNTTYQGKKPIVHGPGPITTARQNPPQAFDTLLPNTHESASFFGKNNCFNLPGQATHAWRQQSNMANPTAMISTSPLHGEARFNFDDGSRRCTMQTGQFGESMLRQPQPGSMESSFLCQSQPQPHLWSTGRAYSSTELGIPSVYDGLEPSLRPAAQSMPVAQWSGRAQPHGSATETFHQGSGSSIDERPSKRPRIDLPDYDWTSSTNKTRLLYLDDAPCSRTSLFRSTAPIYGHHLPAAAALASIKGIQPLTDEIYSGGTTSAQSSALEGEGTSNGRMSMDSDSSLSSVSDDEDDDCTGNGVDEYVEEDQDAESD
ncbi:AMP-binding domain-containing protein [Pseudozyma hubeiensis]|nr:AMP-binding domain-containing protein [Pseudozyma hubeiensis]